MPTLTLEVSDAVYHRALALPEAERRQTVENAFASAPNVPSPTLPEGIRTPLVSNPAALIRLRALAAKQAKADALMRERWEAEPEDPNEPSFEEFARNMNENARLSGRSIPYPEVENK